MIDFASASDGSVAAHSEKGFVFTLGQTSESAEALADSSSHINFMTVHGERGLKLSSGSDSKGLQVKREDGTPFTLAKFTISHLERGDGEWEVVSSAGAGKFFVVPEQSFFQGRNGQMF